MFADPFVVSLVTPANDQQVRFTGQFAYQFLGQHFPAWRSEDYPRSVFRKGGDSFKDGFRLKNHSGASAKRTVINSSMEIMGPVAQIVDPEIQEARLSRPLYDAVVERPGEHRREQ